MNNETTKMRQSRREFLKSISVLGGATYLGFGGIFTMAKSEKPHPPFPNHFDYQFRTVSVDHIQEVAEWINKLKAEKKIGNNETFRRYIGGFNFSYEEILPGAKSLILLSLPLGMNSITFHKDGKKYNILIPSGYWDDGVSMEMVDKRVRNDFSLQDEHSLVSRVRLPLKTMSVRSGLADYGKNNIAFVRGYGSFHQLIGYYTEKELADNWRPINMLRLCKGCTICKDRCPTQCIRDDNFVIDVDKCVTLYNEIEDPIPEWIPANVHNAMVGCIHCQYTCPANSEGIKNIPVIAEVTEEETAFLLSDKTDEKLHKQLSEKLNQFPYINYLDYFRRNFRLVMANAKPV